MATGAMKTPEMSRSRVPVSSGESSPSSANFRELDDAFLQSQTRIWLGEVLQIRFDEQANISDLLADGELLYEVSEVISRILPTLVVDTTHPKISEWKSHGSGKSTMRYMPYYNVDAFLRVCKNLGLDSIDLFTPSDVVEKRNTRKVCMCLRSLSKKVRSRDVNVQIPDFDSVTRTLSMPTDMVQYIRKSLELSHSSSSLSAEQDSERISRIRYWRRMSNPASPIGNGYSDDCDGAESSLVVSESHGSSNHARDAGSSIIRSPEVATNDESTLKLQLNLDIEEEGDVEGEYLSPSESMGSPCSEYYSDEGMSSVNSSTSLVSHINGEVLVANSMEKHGYQNVVVNHTPIDLEDSSWDIQNYKDGSESIDEIDDDHNIEDEGKTAFNACSSLSKVHVEDLAQPSEIECESNSYDSPKPVCFPDFISVGDRKLHVTRECAVEDDLCANEAPISESGSFEDEQMLSKDDIGNSYSHDLCVIEDNFCADETPISNFKTLDEQQTEAEEAAVSNGLSPDNGKFHSGVNEAPISESGSFEDEQMLSKDDISNSYSHDLCVIEDDFCADETPISNFKTLDEQQTEAEEAAVSNGLSPDNGKFHSGVNEAPISESGSFEDEQMLSKDDISNSYSHDLCVIEDDFCADETPISNFKTLDEQQMEAEEAVVSNGLSPDNGEFHSGVNGNAHNLSVESPAHSPDILLVGENSCHDSSEFVKITPEDVVGQKQLCSEKCLSTVDYNNSCAKFHLLPDIDSIISADNHQNHRSLTVNEKEAFDRDVITSDQTEQCVDDKSLPTMDLSSFSLIDVTKDSVKCPNKVFEDIPQLYEDHNFMAQSVESKPIISEDSQKVSKDCNAHSESVVGDDKPIDKEDANCVNRSTATLENPQLGADSPRTEDNQCVETMKSEPKNIGGEDNDKEIQKLKPKRKLLKSVVKVTALAGLAVFLLHLRKNIKLSLPKEKKELIEATTRKPANASSEKVKKAGIGISSSVYPAEKLRLGI